MINEVLLRQIMPNLPPAKCRAYLPHLNQAMARFAIDNALRAAAFIAQLAHESGELRWMEEIWGPSDAQRRYEPQSTLAQRLGNVEPGDGRRFKGRGPIQLTGRANYARFGELLGIDLVGHPELAAAPDAAFATAALYWQSRGLNELADSEKFTEITKRINGGLNGLRDREKYYVRAKAVLADSGGFAPARAGRAAPIATSPLDRGFEAIAGDSAATAAPTAVKRKQPRRKARPRKAPAKKAVVKKAVVKKAPVKKARVRQTLGKSTARVEVRKKKSVGKAAAPKRPVAAKPRARGKG